MEYPCIFILITVLVPNWAIEWTALKPNIDFANLKSKVKIPEGIKALPRTLPVGLPKGLPVGIPRGLPKGLPESLKASVGALVAEDVSSADIRLLKKEHNKTPLTHPILPEAIISQSDAISIFMTNWDEYYRWGSDIDTEYRPVRRFGELFSNQHYNSSLSSVIILHDRCGHAKDPSVLKILEAFRLRNFPVNYNIFLLDFKRLVCKVFATSGLFKLGYDPQLRLLGAAIAAGLYEAFEDDLIMANQTNILGLGISSHLAVLVAEEFFGLSGLKVNSIVGLDPAVRLIKRNNATKFAEHTHFYHTYTLVPGMGPRVGRADADFVFDGARRRPECNTIRVGCHVMFGVQVFISTILFPKIFPTRWCPDFQKFSFHFCDTNEFAYVSFPPDSKAHGVYQVQIAPTFPYGLGPEGIFMSKEMMGETVAPETDVDLSKLSDQEYAHALELELVRVRNDVMSCMRGVSAPAMAVRCVLETQNHIKRLVDKGFIKKGACEAMKMSPTGKRCLYTTRTNNEFALPF